MTKCQWLSNGWPSPAGRRDSGVIWKVVEVNRLASAMVPDLPSQPTQS